MAPSIVPAFAPDVPEPRDESAMISKYGTTDATIVMDEPFCYGSGAPSPTPSSASVHSSCSTASTKRPRPPSFSLASKTPPGSTKHPKKPKLACVDVSSASSASSYSSGGSRRGKITGQCLEISYI